MTDEQVDLRHHRRCERSSSHEHHRRRHRRLRLHRLERRRRAGRRRPRRSASSTRAARDRDDVEWHPVDMLDVDALDQALDGHRGRCSTWPRWPTSTTSSPSRPAVARQRRWAPSTCSRPPDGPTPAASILACTVWVYGATVGDVVDETTPFTSTPTGTCTSPPRSPSEFACRDYLNLYEPPVHRPALRHPLRPAHARDDGDVGVLPPGAGRRGSDHRRRRHAGPQLRLRRGPGPGAPAGARSPRPRTRSSTSTGRCRSPSARWPSSPPTSSATWTSSFGPSRPGDLGTQTVRQRQGPRPARAGSPRSASRTACGAASSGTWPAGPTPLSASTAPAPGTDERQQREEHRREPCRDAPPRRIAVVPAYNEEPTVGDVLGKLYGYVDELVVVDDGSTDGTRSEVERFLTGRPGARMLVHETNQGMSEAYYLAFGDLRRRLEAGELSPDDFVYTVDADGQHELAVLEDLHRLMADEQLDALLVQRDLSTYPPYKQAGNWVDEHVGHVVGRRCPAQGRRVGLPDLPPRGVGRCPRLLPGLQVLRDRRGGHRALPARATRCATTCSCRCRCSGPGPA